MTENRNLIALCSNRHCVIMGKATRRAIYWGLLATALSVFVSTIVFDNQHNSFYARHSSAFANVIGTTVALLLVWCAVFIKDEQSLIRLFLIILALLFGLIVALPTLCQLAS